MQSSGVSPGRSGPAPAPITSARRPAPLWEQGLFTLWIFVILVPFERDALILYPLALFYSGTFYLRRARMVPLALQSWPVFLLPAIAVASMLWAPGSSSALRFGLMMTLTAMICVNVAYRLTLQQVVQSIFIACLVMVVLVTPELSGGFHNGGPFGEKNIFARRMLLGLLAALTIAYDRRSNGWLRLAAAATAPIAGYYMLIAESATALLIGVAGVGVLTGVWLFWGSAKGVRHLRSLLVVAAAAVALLGIFAIANTASGNLIEAGLNSVGKDTTLTGRTILWEEGLRVARERPLFGLGAEGYWQPRNGSAETLLELSYKPEGTKFSFHNSYLEIQIHFGLVGLGLLIISILWALSRNIVAWLRRQDLTQSFFLLFSGIVVATSMTESVIYSVFDINVMPFYISAIAAGSVRHGAASKRRAEGPGGAYADRGPAPAHAE